MTTKSQLYINYCSISSRKVLFDHVDALAQLKEGPCFSRKLVCCRCCCCCCFFFFQWTCVRCCKRNLQQVDFRFCPACWDKNKVAPSSLMAYHNHSKHGIMLLSNRDDILRPNTRNLQTIYEISGILATDARFKIICRLKDLFKWLCFAMLTTCMISEKYEFYG